MNETIKWAKRSLSELETVSNKWHKSHSLKHTYKAQGVTA